MDNRTSLIVDPPDCQFPPLTAEAQARRAAAAARPRTRGAPMVPKIGHCPSAAFRTARLAPARITTAISKSSSRPETVVLLQEMIHDARVVPMTIKPHLPKKTGSCTAIRARWEGDTLVVETTNFINGFQDRRLTSRSRALHAGQPRS